LEGAEAVGGRGGQPPGEKEPSANLEKEERHHQRLQDVGAVDVAEYFHHRVVRLCAGRKHQVVGDVEGQEDHDERERRHVVWSRSLTPVSPPVIL
jgi:hypothetical protein